MAGMSGMGDSGSQKLQQLLARLVADPVVGQKIQRDSVLRNRWNDPEVRQLVLTQP
jgi:hypothetical protein